MASPPLLFGVPAKSAASFSIVKIFADAAVFLMNLSDAKIRGSLRQDPPLLNIGLR